MNAARRAARITIRRMDSDQLAPRWLWQIARWGFIAALVSVSALALGLSLGLADPPRAGPLLWQGDFKVDSTRWEFSAPTRGALAPPQGAPAPQLTTPDP